MMDADWYREFILDRYQHPLHRGVMQNPDKTLEGVNPSCGDHLTVQLKLRDRVLEDIQTSGEGCAISQVAADLLADRLIGGAIESVRTMGPDDMMQLLGGRVAPGREKCALLMYETMQRYADEVLS